MLTTDKHVFRTKDGKTLTFPSEDAMRIFAQEYVLGNLIAEGKMEYVTIDGQKVARITAKGMADFKQLTAIEIN